MDVVSSWSWKLLFIIFSLVSSDFSLQVKLGDGTLAQLRWVPGQATTAAAVFCANHGISRDDCALLTQAASNVSRQHEKIWVAMFEPVAYEVVDLIDHGSLNVEFAVFSSIAGSSTKLKQVQPDTICFSIQEHTQKPRKLGCVHGASISASISHTLTPGSNYVLRAWPRTGSRDGHVVSVPFYFRKRFPDAADEAQYFLASASDLGVGGRPHASSQRFDLHLCVIIGNPLCLFSLVC